MNKIMLATGIAGRLRVRDGVLHRLVLGQRVRALRVHQPRVRPVLRGPTGRWSPATCISPQLFWFKKLRTSIPVMFVVSHLRQHRHVVRALRHHRDVARTATSCRRPGATSARRSSTSARFAGTLGLFFTLFLLFIRCLPMIAMAEVKGVLPEADPHHHARRRRRTRARRTAHAPRPRRPSHG